MAKEPLLPGDGYIQKMLNQLPADDREFVLQLLAELGLANDPASMPFFIVFQFYLNFFRRVPAEMRVAAKEALKDALIAYGKIQSEIDESIEKIEFQADRVKGEVDRIDRIRKRFTEDIEALIPRFESACDQANQTAAEAYEKTLKKINKLSLQETEKERTQIRNSYLKDIRWQGFIQSGATMLIAMILVGGFAFFAGQQNGESTAIENIYKHFGGRDSYEFAQGLMTRSDNFDRIIKCQEDNNDKCTLWIKTPSQ